MLVGKARPPMARLAPKGPGEATSGGVGTVADGAVDGGLGEVSGDVSFEQPATSMATRSRAAEAGGGMSSTVPLVLDRVGCVRIDHVVLGSLDLDATSERFLDEHGLASVPGGLHAAWGTANRIVPLGDDYVEFLAVVDPAVAEASRFGRFLSQLTAEGDRWFTVCMADDDIESTAARLGLEVVPGARVRPDGTEVRWRGAGLEDPKRDPWLPFFIEWHVAPDAYPGRMRAEHRTPATGISWVEIAGDAGRLSGWLGAAIPSLRVADVGDRDPGVRRVCLSTTGGEIVL